MPIQVGKALTDVDLGIQGDDTGDNISFKNGSYCELTGIYWAWKNLDDADYVGLCHYRRYFDFHHKSPAFDGSLVTPEDKMGGFDYSLPPLDDIFGEYDVILHRPKTFPCTVFTDYARKHSGIDLKKVLDLLVEMYPDCAADVGKFFYRNNRYSPCNMFIMRKKELDAYCSWLFPLLERAEELVDTGSYDSMQKRIWGFVGERLLPFYVYHNRMKAKYFPVCFMGNYKDAGILRRLKNYLGIRISFLTNHC